MNNTNRALNRLVIALVGLLLLAAGALAALLALDPAARSTWRQTAPGAKKTVAGWFAASPVGGTGSGALVIAVLVVLVVLVILLVAFVFRQGHGHTARLVTDESGEHGSTRMDTALAEQLVQDALRDRPELVSSHVSTYRVRRIPVLKISATARRGVSPRDVVETVESALDALDTLLGRRTPASIQIGGGFRARTARSTRLQ